MLSFFCEHHNELKQKYLPVVVMLAAVVDGTATAATTVCIKTRHITTACVRTIGIYK